MAQGTGTRPISGQGVPARVLILTSAATGDAREHAARAGGEFQEVPNLRARGHEAQSERRVLATRRARRRRQCLQRCPQRCPRRRRWGGGDTASAHRGLAGRAALVRPDRRSDRQATCDAPAVQLSWSDRSLPSSWATLRAAATGGSSLPPGVEIRGDGSVPAGAVVLRVVWPPDLTPARGARRTLVFITAEHLACPDAGLRKQARAQYQALHCLRRAN